MLNTMPLRDITVLDVSTALAGPYAAALLGGLGARVLKVEKPRRGDLMRFTDRYVTGESGYFLGVNPFKEGLTVDMRVFEGQEIIRRLISKVDVIIENFRSGVMDGWHLGASELRNINERLVYCSVNSYSTHGEMANEGGNDITVQGYSGIMDLTGDAEGPPAKAGAPVVDVAASFCAVIGILAALQERAKSGEGGVVETSLIEAAYALMPNYVTSVLNSDVEFHRLGSGHPQLVPYQAFKTRDNCYAIVGAFHRESWRGLCRSLGLEEIEDDARFRENWDRIRNREALNEIIRERVGRVTRSELLRACRKCGVPAAPVLSLRESLELFTSGIDDLECVAEHSGIEGLRMLRPPVRFDGRRRSVGMRGAPLLGETGDEILTGVGYSREEIEALRVEGVI